uniref:BHLH domain-containing protein n=1 Tax=Syphacia muris TaxID=451379 RepID=A0A0N5AG64_9BILA
MSNLLTATSTTSVAASKTTCDTITRARKTKGTGVASKLPHQVLRRNERERKRVQQVNLGFISLRDRVPQSSTSKKLSKVETLREAARYIRHLQELLKMPVNSESEYSVQASSNTGKYLLSDSEQDSYCPNGTTDPAQSYQQQSAYSRQQYYLPYNSSDSAYSSPTYSNSFSTLRKENLSPNNSYNSDVSVDGYCYLPKNYIS